ncbi:MAG: hypothetical protein HYR74_02575 [Candidatus Eisenbacteria bacterium]|nr:hypothetical protein [Candidatus Eisenbacteria bacterium]
MLRRSSAARRAASLVVVSLALPGVLHGCSAPTAPITPPSGGTTLTLSYPAFRDSVEPILSAHGCDATGDCHGGGIRGTLQLSPPSAKDPPFDFGQVSLQVWAAEPDSSPILTRPLATAAGGTPHAVKPFATRSDPEFRTIRAWIMAGVPTP